MHRIAAFLAAAIAWGTISLAAADPAPHRIVSLNPCLDTILVSVADRDQIAALSHYARDPAQSTIADIAKDIPYTYETAEEVLALSPDLVLMSPHNAPATREAIARLGIRAETFGIPETVEASLSQIRDMAALVGHPERGDRVGGEIRAALDQAAPPPGAKPIEAIVFQGRGLAPGRGTLVDEMLTRTGFVNVAARYGVTYWGNIGLESLIADPPQMLLSAAPPAGASGWAERIMNHPALTALGARLKRARFDAALMYCGGPVLEKTAVALAAARDSFKAATQ